MVDISLSKPIKDIADAIKAYTNIPDSDYYVYNYIPMTLYVHNTTAKLDKLIDNIMLTFDINAIITSTNNLFIKYTPKGQPIIISLKVSDVTVNTLINTLIRPYDVRFIVSYYDWTPMYINSRYHMYTTYETYITLLTLAITFNHYSNLKSNNLMILYKNNTNSIIPVQAVDDISLLLNLIGNSCNSQT